MMMLSKINYLDPRFVESLFCIYDTRKADMVTACRITAAWCKTHNVPIEKIFSKTLLVKCACDSDDARK